MEDELKDSQSNDQAKNEKINLLQSQFTELIE